MLAAVVLIVAGAYVVVVIGLRTLYRPAIPRWQAALYWVDYHEGFVRRGLPGEFLRLVVGHTPTSGQVTALGLTLTGAALIGLVLLAVVLARRACTPRASVLVVAVVLVSPFTAALVAWDPGRYDDIGIVALVGLALIGNRRATRTGHWLGPIAIAVTMVLAVACEEFLVAFVAPVGLLALRNRGGSDGCHGERSPATFRLFALMPAAIVAAMSLVLSVPTRTVRDAFAAAQFAGIRITERPWTNGVVVLDQPLGEAMEFVDTLSPWTRALMPFGLAVLYVIGAVLVWRCLDRPQPRLFAGLTLGFGAAAALLGLVGVDYRRWWALAFVALLASTSMLTSSVAREKRGPARRDGYALHLRTLFIGGFIAISVGAHLLPLYPTWDHALGGELPPAVRVFEALIG